MPALGRFRIVGSLEVQAKYGLRAAKASDLTLAWRKIDKGSVTPMLRRQFASKGAFSGQAWAPLRPATKRARLRPGGNRGGINHPLWDSGRLKGSLENVGPESIRVIRPHLYQRGTRVPYGHLHQKGFTVSQWGGRKFRTPRKVPARQVIPDPPPTFVTATWPRILSQHIVGAD